VSLYILRFRRCGNAVDSAVRHPYITVDDSNTLLKFVTREPHSQLIRPHGAFARVLSVLLLGFIVYGTTVEAAHTHGSVLGSSNPAGASSLSDPKTEVNQNGSLNACGDCLICQLHQQFSTTLTSVPPIISASILRSRFLSPNAVPVPSQTSTPRTGRAPPQNSL
jgi:hypothetical protein